MSPSRYSDRPWVPLVLSMQQHQPCSIPPSRLLLISRPYYNTLPLLSGRADLRHPHPITRASFGRSPSLDVGRGSKRNYALYVPCNTSLSTFDHPGRMGISAPYSRRSSERSRDLPDITQPIRGRTFLSSLQFMMQLYCIYKTRKKKNQTISFGFLTACVLGRVDIIILF